MARRYGFVVGLAMPVLLATTSLAQQQVREYDKDGVRYRETRETILRPIQEVRYEDRDRTVYREELSTETREIERLVHVPVTEYHCRPYVRHPLGIFGRRCVAYHLVPRTRLETRTEIVSRPVTARRLVPEKRTERVPVVTRRMVEEEVIRRVAVNPRSTIRETRLSDGRVIGSHRVINDPPRFGTRILRGVWTRGRY